MKPRELGLIDAAPSCRKVLRGSRCTRSHCLRRASLNHRLDLLVLLLVHAGACALEVRRVDAMPNELALNRKIVLEASEQPVDEQLRVAACKA